MIEAKLVALESQAGALLRVTRLDRALRRLRANAVPILMYHSIASDTDARESSLWLAGMTVSESRFREHMRYVARHYTTITLTDYVAWREGRVPLPRSACVVTFDDGLADVHARALPILSELDLKATVFVIGSTVAGAPRGPAGGSWLHELYALLDSADPHRLREALSASVTAFPETMPDGKPELRRWARKHFAALDPEWRATVLERLRSDLGLLASPSPWFMTADELRELRRAGFEIGSHSVTHEYLSRLDDAALEEELAASRSSLEPLLDGSRPTFCYPFGAGALDPRVVDGLRRQGFVCAVSTAEGLNGARTDLYALRRIRVTDDLPLSAFVFRLVGSRAIAWRVAEVLRRRKRRPT